MNITVPIPLTPENLKIFQDRYSNDIGLFGIEMLGLQYYDDWQLELHKLKLNRKKRRIAIKSCHNSGKTLNACILALHHLLCYPYAQVFITSATGAQLYEAFGNKLATLIDNSPIKDWFDNLATSTKIRGATGAFISLKTNSIQNVESFQGLHTFTGEGGPLFIVDEASGVYDEIINAITNNLMEPFAKLILLGNPIYKSGKFYDAFNDDRELYHTITVSYRDTTFLDEQYINDKRIEFGEDSDEWRIRLLGEFPVNEVAAFNTTDAITSAFDRIVPLDKKSRRIGALDVGGKVDKSILTIRQDNIVAEDDIIEYDTDDPNVLQKLVEVDMIKKNIDILAVDFNGIGWSVYKYLNDVFGERVQGVKLTNLSVKDDKKYYNYRAKWWGDCRDWLKTGSLPGLNRCRKEMIEEGTSLLEFRDGTGRVILEKKEDAKKRNGKFHSPDYWDSLCYTFSINTTLIEIIMLKLEKDLIEDDDDNEYDDLSGIF